MNRRDFLKSLGAIAGAAALRVQIPRKAVGKAKNAYKMIVFERKEFDFSKVDDYEYSQWSQDFHVMREMLPDIIRKESIKTLKRMEAMISK